MRQGGDPSSVPHRYLSDHILALYFKELNYPTTTTSICDCVDSGELDNVEKVLYTINVFDKYYYPKH